MSLRQLIRGPNRLSLRLLLMIVLFSTAIALVSTGWQLYRDYWVDVRHVRERLTEAGETRLSAVGHALWSLDQSLMESQLEDMLLLPELDYARVHSSNRITVEAGEPPDSRWGWERRFPITHKTGLGTVELGELVIVGDLEGPYHRLLDSIPVVLATEAVDTFLVALFVLVIIHWAVTRHLVRMHHYVSHLRTDADAEPLRLDRRGPLAKRGADELDELAAAINRMRESLGRELDERGRAEAQAAHLAMYDALTDLPNRRLLLDRLDQVIQHNQRDGVSGALLFLDLDRFKDINDTLGHSAGDQVLIAAGRRIADSLRAEDTVARVGGDEFVVLLPGLERDSRTAALYGVRLAEQLAAALRQEMRIDHYTIQCSASVGVALFPVGEQGPEAVLRAGDTAMYRAKNRGGNCAVLYREEMEQEILERLEIERDLNGALEAGQIDVHYQPQVFSDGRIVGMEALVRWWRNGSELVYPADFIELAERTGLIQSIGQQVLETVCRDLGDWTERRHWPPGARVAVNVSPEELRDPAFVERVLAVIARHGTDPRHLELELTEGTAAASSAAMRARLERLRTAGISISVDDFGTGDSSLAYLKHLPVDRLKIDRIFVAGLPHDRDDAAIIQAILTMAEHLELGVVAEGVETREQLEFLQARGCRIFQGFHFLSASDAGQILACLTDGYVAAG